MKRIWIENQADIENLGVTKPTVVAASSLTLMLSAVEQLSRLKQLENVEFQTALASLGPLGKFTLGAAKKRLQTLSVTQTDVLTPTLALWVSVNDRRYFCRGNEVRSFRGIPQRHVDVHSGTVTVHGRTIDVTRRVLRIEPGPSITWTVI